MEKLNATAQAVWELATQLLAETAYRVYDVTYTKEGSDYYLRLFIDTDLEGGVDLNGCELVTGLMNDPLDEADLINGSYYFEVSSPGVERSLRLPEHYKAAIGEKIYVKCFAKIEGAKEHTAVLQAVKEENIVLNSEKGEIIIPMEQIAKASLSVF